MGIFGGYLAGARAAREDKLKERQQDEAERRARADEALRRSEAERSQKNIEADRAFKKEESAADRNLRQQAIDQGAYQFERTQANADARLGLEMDKGRIETEVLGTQLAATKQRWADEQKERGLREQNNKLGVGYMMSMAMMKPGHQLDANDIAEITQQYPEFAKLGLQGFTMKYNPDTGNMDGLMIVGDGKDKNSVKVFDQAQMANALRGAGYTDESIKRTFEYMRPDIGITKLKTATVQKEAEQAAILNRQMMVQGLVGDRQIQREQMKARADRAKAEVVTIDKQIRMLEQNKNSALATDEQKAEYQRQIDALEQRKLKAYDDVFAMPSATPTETPAPTADPLATKYGKYLKK